MKIKSVRPLVALCLVSSWVVSTLPHSAADSFRDPWLQPFNENSIWNTPIGSGAVYVSTNLGTLDDTHNDETIFMMTKGSDPSRDLYYPASWTNRCGGTTDSGKNLRLPDDFIVADAGGGETPNHCSAFLLPDAYLLREVAPLARCNNGGNVYGYFFSDASLYADGRHVGSHGGSNLSAIGGTIRKGTWSSNEDIKHALKIELDWWHLYHDPSSSSNTESTWRWPARRSDGGADGNPGYTGTNSALKMGSLLALQPSFNVNSLTTDGAKKIAKALQNYGGYVVDTTGVQWKNRFQICMTHDAYDEFTNEYGFTFNFAKSTSSGAKLDFYNDMSDIWDALHVVNNNSSSNIGGGGTPLVSEAVPPMLMSRWQFDNNANDAMSYKNTGSLNGSPSYGTGTDGQAIALNGTSQWVNIDHNSLEMKFKKRTIAMWINNDDLNGDQVLYEQGGTTSGIGLQLSGGNLMGSVRDGGTQKNVTATFPGTGSWVHVALRYNDGPMQLFINGQPAGSSNSTGFGEIPAHTGPAGIGASNGSDAFGHSSTGNYFDGRIDDVRVYAGTVTDAQIAAIVGGGSGGGSTEFYLENREYSDERLKATSSSGNYDLTNDTGNKVKWRQVDVGAGYFYLENKNYSNERLKATNSTGGLDLTNDTGNKVQWRKVSSGVTDYYYLENKNYSNGRLKATNSTGGFDLTNDTGNKVRWKFNNL